MGPRDNRYSGGLGLSQRKMWHSREHIILSSFWGLGPTQINVHTHVRLSVYIGGGFIGKQNLDTSIVERNSSGFTGDTPFKVKYLKAFLANTAPTVMVTRLCNPRSEGTNSNSNSNSNSNTMLYYM